MTNTTTQIRTNDGLYRYTVEWACPETSCYVSNIFAEQEKALGFAKDKSANDQHNKVYVYQEYSTDDFECSAIWTFFPNCSLYDYEDA